MALSTATSARRIRQLVARIKKAAAAPIDKSDFEALQFAISADMTDAFGDESNEFYSVRAAGQFTLITRQSNEWLANKRIELLHAQLSLLKEVLSRLARDAGDGITQAEVEECSPLQRVEAISSRFHRVARSLRGRHDGRQTLEIEDEYDVQDLLGSILQLFFDDIRSEESTPSYAGASSRMDFLLKREKLVVETKMARRGLGAKEVGSQLIVDIGRYRSHPDCKTLFCFVYDPVGLIKNARGIENDLSGEHEGLNVIVRIEPKV